MIKSDERLVNFINDDFQGLHVNTIGNGEVIVFLHGGPGGEQLHRVAMTF